jgi:hypothetical protein
MPLRDFFHPPLSNELDWESVHHVWATTIVRALNDRLLPPRYRAQPEIQIERNVEVDIATCEREQFGNGQGGNVVTKAWAPAEATRALEVAFPTDDLFEVRVVERQRARRLVAAVELVSPSNKDRPESRRTFAAKCASYLQARVSVVIVDTVTDRQHDLYEELLLLLGCEREGAWPGDPPVYATALRTTQAEGHWSLQTWESPLAIGREMPTMPLWLADDLAVPLELEATYEETRRGLRLD